MSAQHDATLTEVAGQLYGALMEARDYVLIAATSSVTTWTPAGQERSARILERIDAALAEGGEYMGSDARWPI